MKKPVHTSTHCARGSLSKVMLALTVWAGICYQSTPSAAQTNPAFSRRGTPPAAYAPAERATANTANPPGSQQNAYRITTLGGVIQTDSRNTQPPPNRGDAGSAVKLLPPTFGSSAGSAAKISTADFGHSPIPQARQAASGIVLTTAEVNIALNPVIPAGFEPWWARGVVLQFRPNAQQSSVDVNTLIREALANSSLVRVISDDPVIAETAIMQAMAEFDTTAFVESKFIHTSVPTSSTLDAGTGVSRLRERHWQTSAGLRRKNSLGGEFEIAQQFGMQTSNSVFFVPEDQGDTRLTLSYNQPLLNGAGRAYNESLIFLAELDTNMASDQMNAALQDHLLQVTEAYWELYLQRSVFLQKQKHLQDGIQILNHLDRRRGIDSLHSQIARARAAVATRRTELIRIEAAIRNTESHLRSLVGAPEMIANPNLELVSVQSPANVDIPVTIEDAMATALENRPEVDLASQEIEAARVRLGVACNELLPQLDLVLETYVSGLKGDFALSEAWRDQFRTGEPSFTAGFVFEVPLSRRQAKSRHEQRSIELRRLLNRFELTVDNLRTEVEVAVRNVDTAHRRMQSQYHSLVAANSDADYLQRRWELLPGDDRSASFLLEDLIDAQDRRAEAERAFVAAQVEYVVGLTRLNRATGTVLRQEHIDHAGAAVSDESALPLDANELPLPELPPAPGVVE